MPDAVKEMAKSTAIDQKKEGWLFTLDYPSYVPFMKYAAHRELRKQLYIAFGSRGFKGDEYDNQEVLLSIARLRHQRATLLGYETYAHYVLEERMAKTPDTVFDFITKVIRQGKAFSN